MQQANDLLALESDQFVKFVHIYIIKYMLNEFKNCNLIPLINKMGQQIINSPYFVVLLFILG